MDGTTFLVASNFWKSTCLDRAIVEGFAICEVSQEAELAVKKSWVCTQGW